MPTHHAAWIDAIMTRYERRLVRYALHLVGDLATAQDIVQDVFLRLCRESRATVDDHVAEWLFTVCRHRAIDHLRKERRMRPLDDHPAPAVSASADPDASLLAADDARVLQRRIAALPPRQREALRLKFEEGLSYRAIASIMDTSISNVGVLLHTAISSLRQRISQGELV